MPAGTVQVTPAALADAAAPQQASGAPLLRISVIGLGYLGVTHAACLAELGFPVVGVDTDEQKVAALAGGEVPFYEPELAALVTRGVQSGRLTVSTEYAAVRDADVHFLCVGTPQRAGEYAADLSYVEAATASLAEHLERACVVVGKSTVPVGTAAGLARTLRRLAPAGEDVGFAWNPEFLREGHAVADTLHPDRIVIGLELLEDPTPGSPPSRTAAVAAVERAHRTEAVLRQVYAHQAAAGVPIVMTDLATAELTKVAANAFLATKISFINAMSEVCEATGADVVALADALGHDARIGRRFLDAGLGFGGGCLPKDIRAFMARAGELGADQALTFLREVDTINMRRRTRTVDLAREMLGGSFIGTRVAVLGAAFKPESDDVRDSPALNVAAQMQLQGASVAVYDPKAIPNARGVFPTLVYAESARQACTRAHLVLLLTEWREFCELDPDEIAALVDTARVLDARSVLDPARWRGAGWTYRALGRP
ncbi:MAG: UDP-glucose dehydrogenase family protein [Actinomycetes bacterium]